MVEIFTPLKPILGIAHGDLRLPWLLCHGNPFYEAPNVIVLTLLPEAV